MIILTPPVEGRPRDRRSTAAARMYHLDVDAVVVMDGDRLVGIVTSSDVVRSIADEVAPSTY
jgi:CBS domain-containing protein